MHLIIGLGNPGAKYEGNRHNIGFMLVDELVRRYGLNAYGSKFHAEGFKGTIDGHDVLAIKPQTYMNRSGISASEASSFFKIAPEQVIVAYDELDLVPGKLRIKLGGGNGGHNGIKDCERTLGKNFWRMRLGIGHPGRKEMVTSYVLSDFDKNEEPLFERLLDVTAKHFPLVLAGEAAKLMTAVAQEMKG
jgi:PTH1 family peptidyl-tRNA hydrolase